MQSNNDVVIKTVGQRAELVGFADMKALAETYPEVLKEVPVRFPFAVSAAKVLLNGILDTIDRAPNPLYFSHYRQVNYRLDRIALDIADCIEQAGFRALPIPASQITRMDPMQGQVCHRQVAWQAGLGSRGLNNLLVNARYGAALRLVTVLTDMPLVTGTPVTDGCDECGRCVDACPSGAIAAACEDFRLDLCYARLCEFRKIPFVGQHICGVCQSVCRGRGTGA